MKRKRRSKRQWVRRGQAMVEFALVIPIFLVVLLGIIETGRFIFNYEVLNNAAREGARYAIVHGSNSSCPSGPMPAYLGENWCDPSGAKVLERVRTSAYGIDGTLVTTTVEWDPSNARESTVRVTATYTYSTLVPLLPLPPITVHAESTLVINN